MKVKMFSGQNPVGAEESINEWLMGHHVKINFIKQTVTEKQIVIISIWYGKEY